MDDGIGVVSVVGGRGCRKAWGIGIEQGRGHGYGAQAGARGVGVWVGARACRWARGVGVSKGVWGGSMGVWGGIVGVWGGSVGMWARTSAMREMEREVLSCSCFPVACPGQSRMRVGISVGEGFGGSAEWGGQELHVEKKDKKKRVAMLIYST